MFTRTKRFVRSHYTRDVRDCSSGQWQWWPRYIYARLRKWRKWPRGGYIKWWWQWPRFTVVTGPEVEQQQQQSTFINSDYARRQRAINPFIGTKPFGHCLHTGTHTRHAWLYRSRDPLSLRTAAVSYMRA